MYTEKQIEPVTELCQALNKLPRRKQDPGPAFPLDKLRQVIQ